MPNRSIPPMKWNAWGDPAAAKPLSPGIRSLLKQALGIDGPGVDEPSAEQVRLRPSALSHGRPRRPGRDRRRRPLHASTTTAGCCGRAASRRWTCCGAGTPASRMRRTRCCSPADEDEVAAILRFCADHSIAVVPFGGGTSVVGGLDPIARRLQGRGVAGPAPPRRTARARRGVRGGRAGRRPHRARGRAPARRTRLLPRPLPAELPVRHHRRVRRDPLVGPGLRGLRPVQRHGPRPARGDPCRRPRPRPRPGVGGRPGPAPAAHRLGGRLRDHHPGAGPRASGPGGHPLRGVVVPRLRHRRRRAARGRPDRHRPDRDPAVRRSRDRRQPRHHREHRRAADHRRLPGDHGVRGHRGARREPARRDPGGAGRPAAAPRWARRRHRRGSTAGSTRPTCAIRCCRRARCARRWRPRPIGPTCPRSRPRSPRR